ncbi:enoyl-CoA hydratase domain-containing protein 3, mitochondrial isoform X2 [Bos indicus x Bos taurus]|uniref:enoyl-CoA hydratase domain-containing protein 3, mitochondrial isoform X1 n=1 Tax=Bos taurus TaxID=9913 RepID=UPI000383EB5B|nr:enoyl-CoA hydratase domain-containing protein 3, mitochondrial isoform X1 [Bos taurus]XP_027416008.1 enoyl-CoA hydratase domain-containing protein 3, mitochondrial isoform X2 [Bos indicus x Bos taurus]
MAAAAGLRALGAKGSGWLRRGPWAPLTTGFCSGGPAGIGRPEPGPRPTIARQQDGIRSIVLSDPKRRNALSLAMLKSLQSDILHEAESQDLKVMMLIQNHPVPIIAMVNGLATAAGCQLVASCDIAVASDKSSFAMPGVNIGVFCSTPAVALGRAVPRKVALEMLFTGEPISAQEALLHGLLSRVVPEERLEEETMRIARKVASLSRSVLSLGKAAFYRQLAQDLRTAYHLTSQTMVDNLGLPDGQEGVKAFLQKRKPVWSH